MANGDIIHQQSYDETGSSSSLSFTPSTTPTAGNTLVVCVTVEHFQASTYTPGNGYALVVDPSGPTNMDYDIANNAFDRQMWFTKTAAGSSDSFTLSSSVGTGGWNLWYWEIESDMTVDKVVSTYDTGNISNFNPAAFPTLDSTTVVTYTIGLSMIHFDGSAKAVGFAGGGANVVTDRGDVASTGGTKAQTSAADKEVTNGAELDQGTVSWSGGVTGPRNTAIAWKEDAGGGGTHYDEENLPTTITVTTTITNVQSMVDALATTTNVTTTKTDLVAAAEDLLTAIAVSTSLTDVYVLIENVLTSIGVSTTETDIAAFVDAVTQTVTVTTTEADVQAMVDALSSSIAVTTEVTDDLSAELEDHVATTVTITTTVTDAVAMAETLTNLVNATTTVEVNTLQMVEALVTNSTIIVSGFDFIPAPEAEGTARVERGVEERLQYSDSTVSAIRDRVRIERGG